MAPKPWGEWSMALSHLALGVVSLHAALSTAQVSTQGLGREYPIPEPQGPSQFLGSGREW